MPVQNARSPVAVSTTARMPSSNRKACQTDCSSRARVSSKALCRSGRFNVTQATAPSTS
jgi:hypothetical protein